MTSEGVSTLAIMMSALFKKGIHNNLPSGHIPNADITVTASTDKGVTPRNHRPYSHNMALQSLLIITISVENVDLGIVQSNHDVLWRKMQARNDALILGDVSSNILTSSSPCCLYQVALLEVRFMRSDWWSLHHLRASRRVKAPRMSCERRTRGLIVAREELR